jgi:hypothetical protein
MAKHTFEQKHLVDNIKGQLMAGGIAAFILLILWVAAFDNYPPQPEDLTNWSFFALFAVLPVSLLLLLAPLHARTIKSLTLPDEELSRFVIFVQRYTHVSRLLFLWVCFAALPAVILRWIDAPLTFFLAAIVALLCGIGSIYELRAYYGAVEVYYGVLPPDLLQEEIEEAQKRPRGVGGSIFSIVMFLQLSYEYWSDYTQRGLTTHVWQTWGMGAIFFILVLGIINSLLFMLLVRRWVKRLAS